MITVREIGIVLFGLGLGVIAGILGMLYIGNPAIGATFATLYMIGGLYLAYETRLRTTSVNA